MSATLTFDEQLKTMSYGQKLNLLLTMVDDLKNGRDETLGAIRPFIDSIGAQAVVVGGAAVIRHGYERTTKDRDLLVDHRHARELGFALMDDENWERLEIREYAFQYKPNGMVVDFLVSRNLMDLGRPYYFPDVDAVEHTAPIEGIPTIGLHELIWFKLLAGRMRDLGDIMELCKLNEGKVDPERVLKDLQPEDQDLRDTMMDLLRRVPIELAGERRLGQGEAYHREMMQKYNERNRNQPGTDPAPEN